MHTDTTKENILHSYDLSPRGIILQTLENKEYAIDWYLTGHFIFSLSDYFKPENNTFKYRFVGLHNDWRTLSKTNVLSFSNLPPGEYALEVMASTNYGMWNEQTITLPVKVNQIFYIGLI